MHETSTAIVIVTYNGDENTRDCLRSLKGIVRNNDFVIIVDNHSSKPFVAPKEEAEFSFLKDRCFVLRTETNTGFSGGNNKGIHFALAKGAKALLLLNNDTVVDTRLLAELLRVADTYEDSGIIAPKIYFAKGYEFHKTRYKESERGRIIWYAGGELDWKNVIGRHRGVDEVDKGEYDSTEETDFASGCCMFIKKEVIDAIGVFDDRYFLYYEDADFSYRAKKNGFSILFAPKAIVWHKNAGSAGGSGSELQDYYITRNRLMFGFSYAPIRSKLSLIKESISLFRHGRLYQRQGVIDFYRRRFGKGSYPLRSR